MSSDPTLRCSIREHLRCSGHERQIKMAELKLRVYYNGLPEEHPPNCPDLPPHENLGKARPSAGGSSRQCQGWSRRRQACWFKYPARSLKTKTAWAKTD